MTDFEKALARLTDRDYTPSWEDRETTAQAVQVRNQRRPDTHPAVGGDDMTARQAVIVAFVTSYWLENGFGPNIREIAAGCGISSTSVTDYNIRALRRRGALAFDDDTSRTLRPMHLGAGTWTGGRFVRESTWFKEARDGTADEQWCELCEVHGHFPGTAACQTEGAQP